MKSEQPTRKNTINIVLIEDHLLVRDGFVRLLHSLDERFYVLFVADHGKHFIEKLKTHVLPDIIITDIRMKEMDGFGVMNWMREYYPRIPIIALTMFNEVSVCNRVKESGAKGLLLKSDESETILKALHIILDGGFYFSEPAPDAVIEYYTEETEGEKFKFKNKLEKFSELLCEDFTLKEIAHKVHISEKTAERYRTFLFLKTEVKSRIGFMRYAIKNRWFKWG